MQSGELELVKIILETYTQDHVHVEIFLETDNLDKPFVENMTLRQWLRTRTIEQIGWKQQYVEELLKAGVTIW